MMIKYKLNGDNSSLECRNRAVRGGNEINRMEVKYCAFCGKEINGQYFEARGLRYHTKEESVEMHEALVCGI